MCKVSIILPSLNVRPYITQCLQSAVSQTLQDIEILCVDAGSTDGTLDVILEFMERDRRIVLVPSEKKSYGYQMNLGIGQAKGKYIGILETDDYIPVNMYENLYTIAEQQHAEIVKADFYRFKETQKQIERTYNRLDGSDTWYNQIICPREHPQVFRMLMNTWSGIYLRSFLKKNQIRHNETPGASFQDNGFWFKTFCCAERIYFVDKPYYMNRRDNASSSVYNSKKVYCMSEEYEYIYKWLTENKQRYCDFIGPFVLKKYHSLLFTYRRIDPAYRAEFVQHFSQEMKRHIEAGECDRLQFHDYEWKRLRQIAYYPEQFHTVMSACCEHNFVASHFKGATPVCCFVRKLDRAMSSAKLGLSLVKYEGLSKALRRRKWKQTVDYIEKGL